MTITRETRPYELLVRWDADGNLAGAHVGFRSIVKEDGIATQECAEPPMPVDLGQGQGFPLADVLSGLQADLLVANAALETEKAALVAERDRLAAEKAALLAGEGAP